MSGNLRHKKVQSPWFYINPGDRVTDIECIIHPQASVFLRAYRYCCEECEKPQEPRRTFTMSRTRPARVQNNP